MSDVKTVAEFFFLSITLGLWGFSIFVNPKMTGGGFLKLVSCVCAGTTTCGFLLTTISHGFELPMSAFYIGSLILFVWNILNPYDGRRTLEWIIYFCLTIMMIAQIFYFQQQDFKLFTFFMGSTLLLGSVVFSMLLGHWYLVVPKLSEKPLLRLTQFTWFILSIKLCQSLIFINNHPEFFELGTQQGAGYSFNWMMLTMRVGWGYLVILVMSIFGYRLIKMRSLQSATGILYAMTVFILGGELASSYLYYEFGMLI
jgi:hypothetical protein